MDECPIRREEGSLLGNRLVEEFGVEDEDDLPLLGQGRTCIGKYVLGRLHEQEHPSRLMETASQESVGDCPAYDEELDGLTGFLPAPPVKAPVRTRQTASRAAGLQSW